MKTSEGKPAPVEAPPDGRDELTGLPGLLTWRGVYVLVFGSFVLWVALLLALTLSYS